MFHSNFMCGSEKSCKTSHVIILNSYALKKYVITSLETMTCGTKENFKWEAQIKIATSS